MQCEDVESSKSSKLLV